MKRSALGTPLVVALALFVCIQGTALGLAAPAVRAAHAATVEGVRTRWQISVIRARVMDSVPHTIWKDASRFRNFHFVVLTLNMTNVGSSADPYDDLYLVLAMHTGTLNTTPGWGPVDRKRNEFAAMYLQAARQFGGVVPWTPIAAQQTRTYCYVFAVIRGQQQFGLFNFNPAKGYHYLLDSGV